MTFPIPNYSAFRSYTIPNVSYLEKASLDPKVVEQIKENLKRLALIQEQRRAAEQFTVANFSKKTRIFG